jgi:hypothetical protein
MSNSSCHCIFLQISALKVRSNEKVGGIVGEVANNRYCKVSDHGDGFSFLFYFGRHLENFSSCD